MLEAQRQHTTRGDAATRACRTSIAPPNPIRFTRAICGDLAQAERREWWIANGLGGYAGGNIAGSLTRRYHGLLIAPIGSPLGRRLLLAKADATVIAGAQSWPLFTERELSPRLFRAGVDLRGRRPGDRGAHLDGAGRPHHVRRLAFAAFPQFAGR